MTRPGEAVRVAIVGATGAVGHELRRQLERRDFPVAGDPVYVASERSVGRKLPWRDRAVTVGALSPDTFAGVDVALFSAGASRSRDWCPVAVDAGAVVVDNSSAWRMDPQVPLVVAEVNAAAVHERPKGIVANPNCTTMTLMVAVKPLHDAFGLTQMFVTTYQAAGGAGQSGIDELVEQTVKLAGDPEALRSDGAAVERSIAGHNFARPIAFNVLPHCGDFDADRYTVEERKLVAESRKVLDLPELAVSPTNVRVPVVVGHSLAGRLTFSSPVSRAAAVDALTGAPGLVIEDGIGRDGEALAYPTPLASAGRDEVLVGRIREDLADDHSLNLFVSGDNLRKGAALNTVQIAELIAASA